MGSRVCDIKKKFEGLCESSKDLSKIESKPAKLNSLITSSYICKPNPENGNISAHLSSRGNIKRSPAFRLEKGNRNIHKSDTQSSILNANSQNLSSNLLPQKSDSNETFLKNILPSHYERTSLDKNALKILNTGDKNLPSTEVKLKNTSVKINNNDIHKPKFSPTPKYSEEPIRPASLQLHTVISRKSSDNQFSNEKSRQSIVEQTTSSCINQNNENPLKKISETSKTVLGLGLPLKITNNTSSELDDSLLSNTLKKVLKSPLPSGPPPKKPPRTFAHVIEWTEKTSNHCNNSIVDGSNDELAVKKPLVKPIRSKTESQIMLKKLEMALNNHKRQGKIIEPNTNKKKLSTEKCVSNSNSDKLKDETNHLTIARKTSLPETPCSDKVNSSSGCFGVLSCSNSMELVNSSHIYDVPIIESKSQFYTEKPSVVGPSSLNSFRPMSKENIVSDKQSNCNKGFGLQNNKIEPVYAKPQSKSQRKQSTHLGNLNLPCVSSILKNMESVSEGKVNSSDSCRNFRQPTLHYMSSPILEQAPPFQSPPDPPPLDKGEIKSKKLFEKNNIKTYPGRSSSVDFQFTRNKTSGRSFSVDFSQEKDFDNEKIQKMVNELYSKCLSMPQDSDSESVASTPDESISTPLPGKTTTSSEEALRERQQRTAERKTYLKRVCSRATSFHRPSTSYPHLFEYLLLIGLDLNPARCKVPYIKAKYPEDANVPDGIEHLCFPDASDWPPQACADESGIGSCYCIVITHSSGSRKYGYCRRVQPEGAPICLPLAYCIVSPYKANHYFGQVLAELESRHGLSDQIMSKFIQHLHQCPFPAPGKGLLVINPVTNEMMEILTRKLDPRQEEMDLARLLNIVRFSVFLQLFVTMLLERKVVLLSYSISKLSTCVEGLCAALYPFHWQHTLVPIVPSNMLDLCHAPTPYVIGLLKSREPHAQPHSFTSVDQVLVVDVDECKVLQSCGDESTVLPSRLCRGLREALQCAVPEKHAALTAAHNLVASEALVTLFVQLVGHYRDHIITSSITGKREFQREGFVKSVSSNTVQSFLDWFSETAMFSAFIESRLDRSGVESCGLFEQRCVEHLSQNQAPSKSYRANLNKTVKIFGDRFKEWTSS